MNAHKTNLRTELASVMEAIREAQTQPLELAATVATVAALMSKSWTIRYQLASMEYDAARKSDKRAIAATVMVRASKEAENWAKRLIIARKALDDDDIHNADLHDQEQADLAAHLKVLAG